MGSVWGFAGAAALLVGGCGIAHQAKMQALSDAAEKAHATAIAACDAQYPIRKRGSEVALRQCKGAANIKYALAQPGTPNADLVRLANARSAEAAERYDSGKLTDAQYELELAAISSELVSGMDSRSNAKTMAEAAEGQANAAQQQAASQRAQDIEKAFAPPKKTRCTTIGNTTNCSTN